jgi:hypothetical protein
VIRAFFESPALSHSFSVLNEPEIETNDCCRLIPERSSPLESSTAEILHELLKEKNEWSKGLS